MTMKTAGKLFAFAAACAVFCNVCHAKTTLPRLDSVSEHVAAGESSVLQTPIEAAGESRLVKTGEGELTVPVGTVVPGSLSVDIGAGAVMVGNAETAGEISAPAVIGQSASFWLASDAEMANFSTETQDGRECVLRWRDVRDTDSSVTNYPFLTTYPNTASKSFVSPYIRTVDGNRTVYFRGWGSRCAMRINNKAGVKTRLDVGSVFLVTSVSNTWGYALGDDEDAGSYHIGGGFGSGAIGQTYYTNRRNPAIRCARFYDNAERRDSRIDTVQKGMHIIEFHHPKNALAKSGNMVFGWSPNAGNREGGDDIMELIIFGTPLAEADRLSVLRYLAAKWNAQQGRTSFRTAQGTALGVAASGVGDVLVSGDGTCRASVSGVAFSTGKDALFGGLLDVLPAYAVTAYSPAFAFSLESGETLNVVRGAGASYGRDVCTKTESAPVGTVVKTGTGAARVAEIPDSVAKLEVQGGCLTLSPPVRSSLRIPQTGANDIFATISNANFESSDMTAWTLTGNSYGRFRRQGGVDTWVCPFNAPEGEWVLRLQATKNIQATATTSVTVPVSGQYAFSFMGSGRGQYGVGLYYISFIRDGVTNTCDEVDVFCDTVGYAMHRLLTPYLEAGVYTLRIASNVTGDSTSTFDDFKMKLVTENPNTDGAWRIPNGGFENLEKGGVKGLGDNAWNYVSSLNNFTYSPSNRVVSWTFTQGGSGMSGAPSVGVTHAAMVANGVGYFHNANLGGFGDKYLAFYSDGGTATSGVFTPPAGKFRLRFKAAFAGFDASTWHGNELKNFPVWSATVTVNSDEYPLGTVSGNLSGFNKWKLVTLPNEIVIPEGASVSVSLRQTNSSGAGFLDDVELVPCTELVADGGFEDATWDGSSAWQRFVHPEASNPDNFIARHAYSNQPQYFGYDTYEGDYCLKIWYNNRDAAWQDIAVPSNGLYRLTFFARARVDERNSSDGNRGHNPIRVWMAQGDVTNEIGRTAVDCDEFRPYTYFWRAPAAGTYRLGFSSTMTANEDRNTMIDGVSLKPVADELVAETPRLSEDLEISVSAGAKLALDFSGTVKVGRLRIAGRNYSGIVDASTVPGVITGQGAFEVKTRGMILILR